MLVIMTTYRICVYVKVTWLNPAGGQFDIKWDVAMCSSQNHGASNGNSSGGNHLQSMLYPNLRLKQILPSVFFGFKSVYSQKQLNSARILITVDFNSQNICICKKRYDFFVFTVDYCLNYYCTVIMNEYNLRLAEI